jgi:hypothetical protein
VPAGASADVNHSLRVAVGALVTAALALGTAPADAGRPDLHITGVTHHVISAAPGHQVAAVRFRLREDARVTAVVTGKPAVRATFSLGRLDEGHHVFRWRGTQPGVGRVPAGIYRIRLTAHRAGRTTTDRARVVVRSAEPKLYVSVNRGIVYPRTTLFEDVIRIGVASSPRRLTATVVGPDGRMLRTLRPERFACDEEVPIEDDACVSLTWDGRVGGHVVRAGSYWIRLEGSDGAGHVNVAGVPATVDPRPLVARTTTTTVAPASLSHYAIACSAYGPLGCGDQSCGPDPSTRFTPGGLSFGACDSALGTSRATAYFGRDIPGPTGHERLTVTATGGPADAGNGSAGLSSGDQRVTMQGDGSFTIADLPFSRGRTSVVGHPRWLVDAQTAAAYDVQSFTLVLTDFVPTGS